MFSPNKFLCSYSFSTVIATTQCTGNYHSLYIPRIFEPVCGKRQNKIRSFELFEFEVGCNPGILLIISLTFFVMNECFRFIVANFTTDVHEFMNEFLKQFLCLSMNYFFRNN